MLVLKIDERIMDFSQKLYDNIIYYPAFSTRIQGFRTLFSAISGESCRGDRTVRVNFTLLPAKNVIARRMDRPANKQLLPRLFKTFQAYRDRSRYA